MGGQIDIGAVERWTLTQPLVVDNLGDEVDGNIGPDQLSLREAVHLAHGSLGPETISFAASLTSGGPASILLTHGELAIRDSMTINGPGASLLMIDASGNDPTPTVNNFDGSRVFNIYDESVASLKDVALIGLTITGGQLGGIRADENVTISDSVITGNSGAGAIYNLYSLANLTLIGCTVSNNSGQEAPNVFGVGGGVFNNGYLKVIDSTISGNVSGYQGGGIAVYGDAMIINSTLSGNIANGPGGAISMREGGGLSLTVVHSTISGNMAAGNGGGIQDIGQNHVTITTSTVSGNTAGGGGGGIDGGRYLTITDSTISGNSANGDGGGIAAGTFLEVTNSTISGNSAGGSGGGIDGGGVISNSTISANRADADDIGGGSGGGISGDAEVFDSIVADNFHGTAVPVRDDAAGAVGATSSLIGVDIGATITDGGGNLIGTPGSPIDPLLGPLADNGGPTETRELLAGSPAIDAGSPLLATSNSVDSSTSGDDLSDSSRLIDNSGFDDSPTGVNYLTVTHAPADADNSWATVAPGGPGSDYFASGPAPELTFSFDTAISLTDLVVWGYADSAPSNNEAKSLTVEFSTDGGSTYYDSIQLTHARTGVDSETISLGGVFLADTVRITITDNYFGAAGARVASELA